MMRTLARRMASEQVWDQSAYSQEGLWPALGLKGRVGSRVSLRVLSYACFCNTKWFFRHLLNEPTWRHHRPVSVHTNYHPEKQQRMQAIFNHYHVAEGKGDWAALRRWSGTEGSRRACGGGGGGGFRGGREQLLPDEMVELSSRGPWLFHNLPPRTPAQLLAAPDAAGRAGAFAAVRFLPGGGVAVGSVEEEPRALAAAPAGVRARGGAPLVHGGSWSVEGQALRLRLGEEDYTAFRRGRALICARCSDGVEVFARYEGLACNTSGWHRLRPSEAQSGVATTVAGAKAWRWQGRHDFTFHADGRLDTPWHKGVWGVAPERGERFIFARFANIDHLLHVADKSRIESTRCEDGDKVTVSLK